MNGRTGERVTYLRGDEVRAVRETESDSSPLSETSDTVADRRLTGDPSIGGRPEVEKRFFFVDESEVVNESLGLERFVGLEVESGGDLKKNDFRKELLMFTSDLLGG